ncbi:hypothetical protein [Nocardia salmonicida]|uniref:hypothetical protein n=1 Tax=Nocardia salmonicida TaxID=53431 RepID=UPI0033CF4ECD
MITAVTRRHVAEELRAAAAAYRTAVDGPSDHAEELAAARWHTATAAATVLLTDCPGEPAQPADGGYQPGDRVLWIVAASVSAGLPLVILPGTIRDEAYPASDLADEPGRRVYVVELDDDPGPVTERILFAAALIRYPSPTHSATRRAD